MPHTRIRHRLDSVNRRWVVHEEGGGVHVSARKRKIVFFSKTVIVTASAVWVQVIFDFHASFIFGSRILNENFGSDTSSDRLLRVEERDLKDTVATSPPSPTRAMIVRETQSNAAQTDSRSKVNRGTVVMWRTYDKVSDGQGSWYALNSRTIWYFGQVWLGGTLRGLRPSKVSVNERKVHGKNVGIYNLYFSSEKPVSRVGSCPLPRIIVLQIYTLETVCNTCLRTTLPSKSVMLSSTVYKS